MFLLYSNEFFKELSSDFRKIFGSRLFITCKCRFTDRLAKAFCAFGGGTSKIGGKILISFQKYSPEKSLTTFAVLFSSLLDKVAPITWEEHDPIKLINNTGNRAERIPFRSNGAVFKQRIV